MKSLCHALLALMVLSAALSACKKNSPPNLAGFWEGSLQVREIQLRLVLKISKTSDGSYVATMDSVDQGSRDIPVTSITVTNPVVRVEIKAIGGVFQGILSRNASEIAGTWQQGGTKLPLVLKRTDKPGAIAQSKDPAKDYRARKDSDLQGHWKGTLAIKLGEDRQLELRLIVKISEAADGTFSGALDSVDQGAKNLPVTSIKFTDPTLRVELKGLDAAYEGALNKTERKISGTWNQIGRSYPLSFERSDRPAGGN